MMDMDYRNLPDENNQLFQNFIKLPSRQAHLSAETRNFQQDAQPAQLALSERDAPYVSFGANGTTASVGMYGSLMRMCRCINRSDLSSKLIGLEFGDSKAWFVYWRAAEFMENAESMQRGFGLQVNGSIMERLTLRFENERWPIFEFSDNAIALTIKLSCQDNMVVQQVVITNKSGPSNGVKVSLDPNFCVQDLDYANNRSDFNVDYKPGPHGYGIVVMENNPELPTDEGHVCVLIDVYDNGKARKLPIIQDTDYEFVHKLKPIRLMDELKESTTTEFTAVFKLQTVSKQSDWTDFLVQSLDLNLGVRHDVSVSTATKPIPDIDNEQRLNWHLKRNLEHILSVCAMPVPYREIESEKAPKTEVRVQNYEVPTITLNAPDNDSSNDEVIFSHDTSRKKQSMDSQTVIALTCGDFGDHRVSISGSYFAFMFMLAMHGRLSDNPGLQQRIYETCSGHLRWLSKLTASQALSSNLWVDGSAISFSNEDEDELQTDLPPDIPSNLPSHIIKATEYSKVFTSRDDLVFVCSCLNHLLIEWFKHLLSTQNQLTPIWQHLDGLEIPLYRFSDHVWIWKALQNIEYLIGRVEEAHNQEPHHALEKFLQVKSHLPGGGSRKENPESMLDFTAEDLRKLIIRRFTLENDILRERMLSVTRTASETRFLFHSRDTILYYGVEWGFFDSNEDWTLWQRLVDAQPLHEEASNDENEWDNPLRYGLAIEMACRGDQLTRTYDTPDEMLLRYKKIIINSSSKNGLFPGQLDPFSNDPVLFDREIFRDFYFHVGFEIPYILLRESKRAQASSDLPESPRASRKENAGQTPVPGIVVSIPSATGKPEASGPKARTSSPEIREMRRTFTQGVVLDRPPENLLDGVLNVHADGRTLITQRRLKRQNPYGRLVDLSNIVEVPEEWLYKYPDMLNFGPPSDDSVELSSLIAKAPSSLGKGKFDPKEPSDTTSEHDLVFLEDIHKGRKHRKYSNEEKSVKHYLYSHSQLWDVLKTKRTAKESKKRYIHLRAVDHTQALMCYLASPESERANIEQFFDRHAKSDAFMYDDTVVELNTWVTEVHFRFYRQASYQETSSLTRELIRAPKSRPCGILGKDSQIVDVMIGFRILGDFFDRYWTCHVIGNYAFDDDQEFEESFSQSTIHGQQRKVLELMLFNRIIKKVCENTASILEVIEKGPNNKTTDKTETSFSEDGFQFENRRPEDLRECFQILVILRNNTTSLQGVIEQWSRRDSTVDKGRPRWTRNDEQKYRKAIKNRMALLEGHVRDLKATEARIEFLIALVTGAQDAIRSTKSLEETRNITLFTYVTVFFLPVGLATSIFSINGVPGKTPLVYTIVTAVVALVITVGILLLVLNHQKIYHPPSIFARMAGYQPSSPRNAGGSLAVPAREETREDESRRRRIARRLLYRGDHLHSMQEVDDVEKRGGSGAKTPSHNST